MISAINRQRFDNATGTGALNSPGVEPYARVYYTANYPDPLGRVVATANYGTNGAASWTRPTTIPASSATILVTGFLFDNAGLWCCGSVSNDVGRLWKSYMRLI